MKDRQSSAAVRLAFSPTYRGGSDEHGISPTNKEKGRLIEPPFLFCRSSQCSRCHWRESVRARVIGGGASPSWNVVQVPGLPFFTLTSGESTLLAGGNSGSIPVQMSYPSSWRRWYSRPPCSGMQLGIGRRRSHWSMPSCCRRRRWSPCFRSPRARPARHPEGTSCPRRSGSGRPGVGLKGTPTVFPDFFHVKPCAARLTTWGPMTLNGLTVRFEPVVPVVARDA